MTPLQLPVRIGRFDPVIVDTVVRWGPVSVLTARDDIARPRILVEEAFGLPPMNVRRTEPRC